MTGWPGLRGDHHVHSTFSDDAVSTLDENVAAARAVGLTELRLVDHVRSSTTWVPQFLAAVAAVRAAQPDDAITIRSGVEAKLLDAAGHLDIPADLVVGHGEVDRVLIADHQFPGPDGPWSPRRVLAERDNGLRTQQILDTLVDATVAAIHRVPRGQLAHPFSLLPKIGLTEHDLHPDHLVSLAKAAADTGTLVEVNEKWGCPGPSVITAFREAGVVLVASTDAHDAREVGRYRRVAELTDGLP